MINTLPRILLPRFEFPAWLKHGRERAANMLAPLGGMLAPLGVSGVAAGPTTLIYDTFTDTNGTALASHTIAPTNTPATSWTNHDSQTITIQSNQVSYAGGTTTRNTADAGVADCTVSADVACAVAASCYPGIYFRWQDTSNHWYVDIAISEQIFFIMERTGGGSTARASSSFTVVQNTFYPITVVLSGTSIQCSSGATTLNYTSAAHSTRTAHGIGTYNNAKWDNFLVTTP